MLNFSYFANCQVALNEIEIILSEGIFSTRSFHVYELEIGNSLKSFVSVLYCTQCSHDLYFSHTIFFVEYCLHGESIERLKKKRNSGTLKKKHIWYQYLHFLLKILMMATYRFLF